MVVLDHGEEGEATEVELLIDSGVNKTLISEKDWKLIKKSYLRKGQKVPKLKKSFTIFSPFGTNMKLPIMGRTKCRLEAACGRTTRTIVFIVKGKKQSLLGLKDGKNLGIIEINPEGKAQLKAELVNHLKSIGVKNIPKEAAVNHLYNMGKKDIIEKGLVSGGETQDEIDANMKVITDQFPGVFTGLGRAKVEPIEIEIDPAVKPVQQKERRIALHYKERFKDHIDELKAAGVVEGPLTSKSAHSGWISNPVITAKSYSDKRIRVKLDTRPMSEAVKQSHFPMPTPNELRHEFHGSDRFSTLDCNHAFHQFELSNKSKDLYCFYTPWGLHRFNTLVMGVSSGSGECHERIRLILQ